MLDMNATFRNISRKSSLIYSPTLSHLKILIFFPDAFSISAFNSMNFSKTSDFFLMKKAHVYLEKSSVKVITYRDHFKDVMGIGPLISE